MSVRDALLLNLTGSNFEALQSNDTARIKGDLSFEKDNETKIVEVDVSQASINVTGRVTGSSNISSSLSSTGSFGHVVATTFHGDGFAVRNTLPRSPGLLTSSAQIADVVTGSFFRGFEFSSSISGSATSTGSFGRVEGVEFFGDGSNIKTTLPRSTGILSSSAQIASQISGAFTSGFEFSGLTANEILSASYVGVSGSTFANAGNATTMSISSLCGSDFDYRLADGITAGKIKGSSYETGVWSATTAMISATHGRAMAGTQNAFLSIGGYSAPTTTTTEKFNGSSWSVSAALISSAKASAGVGTQNAAGMFGGYDDYDQSEFYNGAAWSNGPNMGTTAAYRGSAGTQNAALIYGGNGPGNAKRSTTELYNGNVFTETADLNTARGLAAAGGTQNDAIYAGGIGSPTGVTCTETWNGTSWTEVADMITMRWNMTGIGTANHHVAVTGHAGGAQCNSTEEWNGTSWSEVNDLISLRSYTGNAAGGLGSQGIYAGGYSSPGNAVVGTTELWNATSTITGSFGRLDGGVLRGDATDLHSTLPYDGVVSSSAQLASNISGSFNKGFEFSGAIKGGAVVWSSTEEMITGRSFVGAQGNSEAALAAGGTNPGGLSCTEEYNGTSWSEVNDMIVARDGGMAGPSTNDAYFGGGNASWGNIEKWDGTSWTNISYPSGPSPAAGVVGLPPGGVRGGSMGGCASDYLYLINSTVYAPGGQFVEYNVSTETATRCPELPGTNGNALHWGFAGDICTGIVAWGGRDTTENFGYRVTSCWNGTTWSDTGQRLQNATDRAGWRYHRGAGVSSTSAVHIGGQQGPPTGPAWSQLCTENAHQIWDGQAWTVQADLPVPLESVGVTGTVDNTFIFGGLKGTSAFSNQVQSASYEHSTDLTTGSFGRIEFISASGDASGLQSSIQYVTNPAFNVLTGSSQIASQISGSFTSGFGYSGLIGNARGGVFAESADMLDYHTSGNGGSMLQGTAIVAGGSYGNSWPPSTTDNTQVYNGTSWSEVNNLTSGVRGNDTLALAGDSSAAVFFGCCGGGETEEWNGTNWSEVADSPDSFGSGAGGGGESSESAIWVGYFGGRTNTWDGTSWTAANDLNFPRYEANTTGTRDAHFVVGGFAPSGAPTYPYGFCSEVFNGTNWTAVADIIFKTQCAFGMGTYNDAIFAGGCDTGHTACNHSQTFDGTSWAFGPNIPSRKRAESAGSKYSGPAAGGSTNAAWFGGGSPGYPVYNSSETVVFPAFVVSASFGRLDAGKLFGDASGLTDSLPYPTGVVSGSGQLAVNVTASSGIGSYISGSFRHGFSVSGNVSGSATSTGSFGKFIATTIHGDGTSISGSLIRNVGLVSGSAQLSANISGSFNKGFGFGLTALEQISGSYVGVSGSAFAYAKNDTTMSISSICGSDFEFRLADTINQIKGTSFGTGVWSNGTARPTTAPNGAVMGTQKAFLSVGGQAPTYTADSYKYSGDSWTVSATMDNIRAGFGSAGTQNAALVFGGKSQNAHPSNDSEVYNPSHRYKMFTEHYNGGAWSESERLPEGQIGWQQAGTGTQNAALQAFGYFQSPSPVAEVCYAKSNRYNGNTWSADADTVHFIRDGGFGGTQNAAIQAGGTTQNPGYAAMTCVQNYDGTSWSEGTVINTARMGNAFAGVQNAGIIFGNAIPYSAITEEWNGSTWTEVGDLNTTRAYMGCTGAGTSTAAAASTGYGGSAACANTEFWDAVSNASASFHNIEVTTLSGDGSQFSASLQSQLLTGVTQISNSISGSFTSGFDLQGGISASSGLFGGGTWRSGGTLNNAGYWGAAVGHENAALQIGGTGRTQKTEEYNGLVWTEVTDTIDSHPGGPSLGAVGTTEGTVLATSTGVEIWNGSNWSEATFTYPGNTPGMGGVSQNAALFFSSGTTDEWNGTSFTEYGANINGRGNFASSGESTEAAIMAGGATNAGEAPGMYTETWNGTSWTEVADLISGRMMGAGAGHTNHFLMIGGSHSNSNLTDGNVEIFNGTSWSVTGNLITNVRVNSATGGNSDIAGGCGALTIGGASPGGGSTKTEHFVTNTSGSFHHLRGTVGGEIKTHMFNVSGSTMKLPLFSDADLNYNSKEPQESTGSMSGSVDRVADVNIFNKPGNFFFHSDYNALGFTYVSSSVYSQSLDFATCTYQSASTYTSSQGFITQSHYCYHNVIQYITGSYT